MPEASKLLADVYDSARQASFANWGDESGFRTLLGRMRLDSILYDKVAVNDAAVFDGVFFLNAAHEGLLDELPWSKIAIQARAPTIEECLRNSIGRPGKEFLEPYWMSSLADPNTAEHLSRELTKVQAKHAQTPKEFASILIDRGIDRAVVDRHSHAWEKIGRYLRDNQIPLSLWLPKFHFEPFVSRDREKVAAALVTECGRECFASVWEVRASRNMVRARLEEAYRKSGWLEMRDISTIDTWYNFAYQETLAFQHECTGIEVTVASNCWPYSEAQIPVKGVFGCERSDERLAVPDDFLLTLGRISAKAFENRFGAHNQTSEDIRRWRDTRSLHPRVARDLFRGAIEDVVDWVYNQPFDIVKTTVRAIEISPVAVISGKMTEQLVGERLTRRSFFKTMTSTVVAIGTEASLTAGTEILSDPNRQFVESIVRMEEARSQV